jgi:EAL domain-containing protein (putative c-di-GMP-specific phosphodiesterase class I)
LPLAVDRPASETSRPALPQIFVHEKGGRLNLSDLILSSTHAADAAAGIPEILSVVRQHLRMDVAFVAKFEQGKRVYRYVDADSPVPEVKVGEADPLDSSYCQRVVDGRMPELMADAQQLPEASCLVSPARGPVRAHLSVPLRLSDGSVYGTFCAFSFSPDRSLNERDLELLRVFADLTARIIERMEKQNKSTREAQERVQSVLTRDLLSVVFQPIWKIGRASGAGDSSPRTVVGLEALSRFSAQPMRSPDVWFQEANVVGLGCALEQLAARHALDCLHAIPEPLYLSVNMSPEHVLDDALLRVLDDLPISRLILEITEHTAVVAYEELAEKLQPLRARGLLLAIDDAGAGYASFRHILNLKPDRIKLDMSITKNIDADSSRRALAAAFARFAEEIGTTLIAEGVETKEELETLQALGIDGAQGNFLSAALPLERALALLPAAQSAAPTHGVGAN